MNEFHFHSVWTFSSISLFLIFNNNSKVCSPSQGPCCTSKCSLKYGDKCRDDNGCREPSYCDGRSAICPPSVNKPNKTICNKEFVCYMGVSKKFFLFINQSDWIIENWNVLKRGLLKLRDDVMLWSFWVNNENNIVGHNLKDLEHKNPSMHFWPHHTQKFNTFPPQHDLNWTQKCHKLFKN